MSVKVQTHNSTYIAFNIDLKRLSFLLGSNKFGIFYRKAF